MWKRIALLSYLAISVALISIDSISIEMTFIILPIRGECCDVNFVLIMGT